MDSLYWPLQLLFAVTQCTAGASYCPAVALREGGHFDFVCSGANAFSNVFFTKDDNPINFNLTQKYNKNHGHLYVSSLTTEDSAVYACRVVYKRKTYVFCSNLTVMRNPIKKPTIFTTSPARRILRQGSSDTLICQAPSANMVLWYKDGLPLKTSSFSGMILLNNTSSQRLYFVTMLPEDTGNYSCEAVNRGGTSWQHFERIVQGERSPATTSSSAQTANQTISTAFVTDRILQNRTKPATPGERNPATISSSAQTANQITISTTFVTDRILRNTTKTATLAVTSDKQMHIHRVSFNVLLENQCHRKSKVPEPEPEPLVFTQVHQLIQKRCMNCLITFLPGDDSVHRMEDTDSSNCADRRLMLRTTFDVAYPNTDQLFRLFYGPPNNGEDTIKLPHSSWSSKWRIIRVLVVDSHHRSLSWRNMNYARAPSSTATSSCEEPVSETSTSTGQSASSSSSIQQAHMIITLFVIVLTFHQM